MVYSNEPQSHVIDQPRAIVAPDYRDRVRWGPILAGLVIAISTQLVLSSIGAAIGLTGMAGSDTSQSSANAGAAVGIWSIISLLIALFIGGWAATRSAGPMKRNTALLNGAILWATTLAVSAWLLSAGVSGAFGVIASNAGEIINQAQQGGIGVPVEPSVTTEQAQDIAANAAKIGWAFALGSLLGLIATLMGSTVGVRSYRTALTMQPSVEQTYVR